MCKAADPMCQLNIPYQPAVVAPLQEPTEISIHDLAVMVLEEYNVNGLVAWGMIYVVLYVGFLFIRRGLDCILVLLIYTLPLLRYIRALHKTIMLLLTAILLPLKVRK
jgi:hypothetical protein